MLASFDIAAQTLHIVGGRMSDDEPRGFATLAPPRKAARGREKDTLILCLGLKARGDLPPERYAALLALAADTFFGSPGSITSALRQALAAVNQKLLDDNLARGQVAAPPAQAGLLGAALRGSDFYAVQSGPGLLLVARPTGHERFPQSTPRALGQSNTLEAVYYHTTVNPGDYLCFANEPGRGWSDIALVGLGSLPGLPAVVERLRETAGSDAAALVLRLEAAAEQASIPLAAPGDSEPAAPARPNPPRPARRRAAGLAEFFRLRPRPALAVEPDDQEAAAPDLDNGAIPVTVEAGVAPEVFWGGAPAPAQPAPAAEPEPLPALPEFLAARSTSATQPTPAAPRPRAAPPATDTPPRAHPPTRALPFQRLFRGLGRAVGVTVAEAIRGLRVLAARVLPEGTLQREGMFVVPTSVQIGIALLIPVLVVGVSVWLYLENGRDEQYAAALTEAQWSVARGRATGDVVAARPYWEAALQWLAEAEALRPGQADVLLLRQEAQGHLDELDWVTRLDYQPLLPAGLGSGARLARLVLVGPDVYVLDQGQNRVLRLTPNPLGTATGPAGAFVVDTAYQCSGGRTLRDVTVGDLIDIALVPGPTILAGDTTLSGDVLVALDSLGALLYCAPGLEQPYASYLAAPEIGWVRPTAIEFYADRLYVLDPGNSEIWQYQASGGAFTSAPGRYFTTVAYDFRDAVEFSIAGGEVFLLRRDGRVAQCGRAAAGAPPTCAEFAQYTDARPGRAVGDVLAGVTRPLALTYDAPPEPSLYLLDGDSSALYQLSLKLVLVRQYRPYFPLAGPITATALDPAKRFYVAAGDNVYVAARP